MVAGCTESPAVRRRGFGQSADALYGLEAAPTTCWRLYLQLQLVSSNKLTHMPTVMWGTAA